MELKPTTNDRLLSIDFFRGFTMFLLIGEFTGLFSLITHGDLEGTLIAAFGSNFHHHPWNGLRFWDLIQPFFMFIVGLSMPFAIDNRLKKGDAIQSIRSHSFRRAGILLFLGWALYCIGPGKITFHFQNVLSQIAFTYLIAFLIIHKSVKFQLLFSVGILVLAEAIYRFFPLEGFNQPFVAGHNFGEWLEYLVDGKTSGGHWASFNALSTTAHTIWGVVIGKLLMEESDANKKLKHMIIAGVALLVVGYALDPIIPIIKRIATTSFVLVSGGWSILVLALSYWIIDIKKSNQWVIFFSVVSMNSLFIYLFAHLGGAELIESIVHPFTFLLFDWMGELTAKIITSFVVWGGLWYICYWMYKKRLFIKI